MSALRIDDWALFVLKQRALPAKRVVSSLTRAFSTLENLNFEILSLFAWILGFNSYAQKIPTHRIFIES